jgi:glutaredoxin
MKLATFIFALLATFALNGATLYYSPSCPHCKEVLKYLESNNQTLEMKNIQNPTYSNELKKLGGSGVPALEDNGHLIVGSANIIQHIKTAKR